MPRITREQYQTTIGALRAVRAAQLTYTAKCGNIVGQADDECTVRASSIDDAMRQALQQFADSWPTSDGPYRAVVWIEDDAGEVISTEEVEVSADGFPAR